MKTVELRDDVYERLCARERDDENVSDLLDRLLDETAGSWRETFGTLSDEEAAELEAVAKRSRRTDE